MKSSWKFLVLTMACAGLSGCTRFAEAIFLPKDARPPTHSVSTLKNVRTPMSDGVSLSSNVYLPENEPSSPTILVRAPYSQGLKTRLMVKVLGRYWASRGYAVMIQSSRGRHPSGGEFYPLLPERSDGIDTLQWLVEQPWCDGRIGMWGGSSFGYTQWAISDQNDPRPRAYMIQIASSETREMLYPGGAFALEIGLYWALRTYRDVDRIPSVRLIDRGVDGFPVVEADDRAVEDIPFFNDWATHRTRDSWWSAIDGENRAAGIHAPVLLMAGWYDPFLASQLEDYSVIQSEADPSVARDTRLIIGPWSHAAPVALPDVQNREKYRSATLAPSLDWFDTHVAETSDAAREMAPVRLFVLGINEWRNEQEWPLRRAKSTSLYLRSGGDAASIEGDGFLSEQSPPEDEQADTFLFDPRNPVPTRGGGVLGPRAGIFEQTEIEQRRDVLVYTSPALKNAVEVTGTVETVLHVSTTAPNTDFTAKLVDVHPDGRAFNVCDGILRQDFEPNAAPTAICIRLTPTAMVFKAGHRIRLEVSSSNFPRFDVNPNTGRPIATEIEPVSARQFVFHTQATQSKMILPVVVSDSDPAGNALPFE